PRAIAQFGAAAGAARSPVGKTFSVRKPPALIPRVGEMFLDFELLRELGRGAVAQVFLARQSHLAGRLVCVNISAQCDDEPYTLAQLQHTNIVPIYSVHVAEALQVVVMPYFGAT